MRARWQALGTGAELLVLGDEQQLSRARAAVMTDLAEVDRACSRFRGDSDLTRLNKAEGRAVAASPLLIEATRLALRAASLTDGAVDPTVGAALDLAGYDCDWALIETRESTATEAASKPASRSTPSASHMRAHVRARVRARWTCVEIDRARSTIRIPRAVKLDLGATAKAWAADRAARSAHAASGCGVLVSLGGDISTAGECPEQGWRIHVTDDHRSAPDAPGQTIAIRDGGLATSSVAVRHWRKDGAAMHHIIDPARGEPASTPWRTVSVAAGDCADANIAATAALVCGARGADWLRELGLPARLVSHNESVLTLGSWPVQERER